MGAEHGTITAHRGTHQHYLFVLYTPAVYTVLTSLSVATLILLLRDGGHLPEDSLYSQFATHSILRQRLSVLVNSGYLVENARGFHLTPARPVRGAMFRSHRKNSGVWGRADSSAAASHLRARGGNLDRATLVDWVGKTASAGVSMAVSLKEQLTHANTPHRDDQWDRIRDFLPGREGHVASTAETIRLFVEAGRARVISSLVGCVLAEAATQQQRHSLCDEVKRNLECIRNFLPRLRSFPFSVRSATERGAMCTSAWS